MQKRHLNLSFLLVLNPLYKISFYVSYLKVTHAIFQFIESEICLALLFYEDMEPKQNKKNSLIRSFKQISGF